MIVVDASVLANALTDDGPLGHVARAELAQDVHWSGPEHLLVEAFSAVRGRLLGGKIAQERARDAVDALAEASIELLPTAPLLRRMWELRDNLSAYDAAYMAAAEAHECALLTSDGRWAQAPRLRCEVRLAVRRMTDRLEGHPQTGKSIRAEHARSSAGRRRPTGDILRLVRGSLAGGKAARVRWGSGRRSRIARGGVPGEQRAGACQAPNRAPRVGGLRFSGRRIAVTAWTVQAGTCGRRPCHQ